MRQTKLIRPEEAENFRCIGSECEDTCCQGWAIPIDRAAYERYRHLPASPLRNLIQISCLVTPEGAVCRDGSGQAVSGAAVYAKIRMTESNQCPMLSGDALCRIHAELGARLLSNICATYPRIVHAIDGIEEKALALSCPEAARVVLLNPGLFRSVLPGPAQLAAEDAGSLRSYFWSIRESVLGLVRNRSYPVWQRLFLLGILCRRLDSISRGELDLAVPTFLGEFGASIASGSLRTAMEAMETLPADLALQLDVVLRLAGMVLQDSSIHPRFAECVEAFKVGIGNGPGATLESLTGHYARSHDEFYAPFFERHPHILENYLINTIVRCRFPLQGGAQPGASPAMAREYALLTAQFALMKGLLIGVSGCHREAFSADHVVHTVQSTARHFEHHPDFLNQAYALLVERQMDGARGLAILLRNTDPDSSRAAVGDSRAAFPQAKAS